MSRCARIATVCGVMRERGQATVELLAVVPVLIVVGLVLWQFILVGHTAWVSAHAARASARAALVGENAAAAARSVLPSGMERGLEIERGDGTGTRVRVAVPLVHTGWRAPVKLGAQASLEAVP